MKIKKGVCSVCGPTDRYHAKGLCGKHYRKFRVYGDPRAGYEVEKASSVVGSEEYFIECSTESPGPLPTQCWLWHKAIDKAGYGRFGYSDMVSRYAHIGSYEQFNKENIPEGLYVCHKCDVRHCVNPDHLFLGNPKDNQEDMYRKRRDHHPPMKGVPQSPRLSLGEVSEIRDFLENHTIPETVSRYQRSYATISRIKRNLTYKEF